ncbi:hypothetical protein [Streptomyces sp. H39-S7]|uniref:hypothetical protein n=1 Tax=Streptomyces sp. H39-S7 TaxID=3004357 RepID=UPI0022AE6CBC|nr:hypothetical protein [Streptomyces sp. H39-S7]MCZ4120224.1 hypothetical protein [Streptomyces sp. H39-S7]
MDLGATLLPVLLGTTVAAALLTPALIVNVRLPWIGYTLAAGDLRAAALPLAIALIIGSSTALAVTVLLRPALARWASSTRPKPSAAGPLRLLALGAFPAFVALALFSGPLLGGAQRSASTYLFAVAGVWITLPWVIGWSAGLISHRAAASQRHRADPARLIAVRTMAARPAMVVRLIAALVIAIGVIGQTQIITSLLSTRSGDASHLTAEAGQSMVLIQTTRRTGPSQEFVSALPPGARMVALGQLVEDSGRVTRLLQGPCPDLQGLKLPCPGSTMEAVVPYAGLDDRLRVSGSQLFGGAPATVRTGPVLPLVADSGLKLLVFTGNSTPMDVPAIKRAAHVHLSMMSSVKPIGEDGDTSFALGYQARWIPFLGTVGTLVLVMAMITASFSEFVRFSQALAPLAVLTDRTRIFHRTAAWALGMPLLIAGAVGTAIHIVLVQPVLGGTDGATLSWTLIVSLLAGTAILAGVASAVSGSTAARQARSWRPRAD